jgi:hypothetical protein
VAERTGDRFEQARALEGIGHTLPVVAAREHWQRALEIFTALGLPQADRVRALL